MITRTSGRLVARISLRDFSGSSSTSMPAALSSGKVSSKMRPLDRASVIIGNQAKGIYQRPPRSRLCRAVGGATLRGWRRRRFGGESFYSFDIRADAAQLGFHLVVAAVQ